jgi:uncharacterized protein (DUF433 family)
MTTDVVRSVLVSRDRAVHGGDAVFVGTRVPVETLIDYLEGGTIWRSSWTTSPRCAGSK